MMIVHRSVWVVAPAQAGAQFVSSSLNAPNLDSGLRRNDDVK